MAGGTSFQPLNTDFDVYSMGADGESGQKLDDKVSLDDIIRATDGGFFGLSEDF